MNNASLYEALRQEAAKKIIRFHMPGHGGKTPPFSLEPVYPIDYTEIYNTGNLYEGTAPISYAEEAAASYFGCSSVFLMTGGSTQGLCAALMTAVPAGGSLLLDRNCHRSVLNAMALLNQTPYYLMPDTLEPFGISGQIAPAQAKAGFACHPEAAALLITSPNYYGVCLDIPGLAQICRKLGKTLIVDQAHGAHFPAVGLPSAIAQGADLAIVSAHKTLPCLGQSGFLLSGGRFAPETIRHALSVFGTSSPSYLLMASMDQAIRWLLGDGKAAYQKTAERTAALRQAICERTDFSALSPQANLVLDPCRLTVCCAGRDITGIALSRILYDRFGIACEMADARNVVAILTAAHTQEELDALLYALEQIRAKISDSKPLSLPKTLPPSRLTLRQAFFSPIQMRMPKDALGCICARPVTPYPPGVAIICPGEEITAPQIEFLCKSCYNFGEEIAVVRLLEGGTK